MLGQHIMIDAPQAQHDAPQAQPYPIGSGDAYRTSAREPEPPTVPSPSWRTLLGPFGRATVFVVIMTTPVILFNVLLREVFPLPKDVAFVPWVHSLEDAFAIMALASFAVLIALIAWRVRPSWKAFSLLQKILYVGALLHAQAIVVAAAETAIFMSQGGLHLFSPVLRDSSTSPHGETAYVYEDCFLWCTTEVYVAEPHALTMTRVHEFSRRTGNDTTKLRIEWLEDGTVRVVDRKRTEPAPTSSGLLGWGGGC